MFKVYQLGDAFVVSDTGSPTGYAFKARPDGMPLPVGPSDTRPRQTPKECAEAYCRAVNGKVST